MKGEASVLNCTKGKKKPHIVNVQFTEVLAKPIKETLIIQKPIDCKLNWRPIAGTMIINVCYTVFYNVKLGISFPHRGLWSTRFVWDSDSNWAASVVPPCSQSEPGTGPAAVPAPRPWACTEGGSGVYKVPATSWDQYIPTPHRGMAELPGQTFLATVSENCTCCESQAQRGEVLGWVNLGPFPARAGHWGVGLVSSKLETEQKLRDYSAVAKTKAPLKLLCSKWVSLLCISTATECRKIKVLGPIVGDLELWRASTAGARPGWVRSSYYVES